MLSQQASTVSNSMRYRRPISDPGQGHRRTYTTTPEDAEDQGRYAAGNPASRMPTAASLDRMRSSVVAARALISGALSSANDSVMRRWKHALPSLVSVSSACDERVTSVFSTEDRALIRHEMCTALSRSNSRHFVAHRIAHLLRSPRHVLHKPPSPQPSPIRWARVPVGYPRDSQ